MHGVSYVLELFVAQRLVANNELVLDLLVDSAGDVNTPRLAQGLQPRRDIHAVAEDVILIDDHVAKIDADTILNLLIAGFSKITRRHALLNYDRAAHRFERTVEHGEKAIPHVLDDPSSMLRDSRVDRIAEEALNAGMRSLLILTH